MNKEFIPYEQALALKELGFDEPCFGLYHNDKTFYPTQCKSHEQFHGQICLALLYQQAFRWFREKYGLCSWITMELGNKSTFCWVLSGEHTSTQYAAYFHNYEEAELACLIKLIEIVKTK
jgi:hypothetical protein